MAASPISKDIANILSRFDHSPTLVKTMQSRSEENFYSINALDSDSESDGSDDINSSDLRALAASWTPYGTRSNSTQDRVSSITQENSNSSPYNVRNIKQELGLTKTADIQSQKESSPDNKIDYSVHNILEDFKRRQENNGMIRSAFNQGGVHSLDSDDYSDEGGDFYMDDVAVGQAGTEQLQYDRYSNSAGVGDCINTSVNNNSGDTSARNYNLYHHHQQQQQQQHQHQQQQLPATYDPHYEYDHISDILNRTLDTITEENSEDLNANDCIDGGVGLDVCNSIVSSGKLGVESDENINILNRDVNSQLSSGLDGSLNSNTIRSNEAEPRSNCESLRTTPRGSQGEENMNEGQVCDIINDPSNFRWDNQLHSGYAESEVLSDDGSTLSDESHNFNRNTFEEIGNSNNVQIKDKVEDALTGKSSSLSELGESSQPKNSINDKPYDSINDTNESYSSNSTLKSSSGDPVNVNTVDSMNAPNLKRTFDEQNDVQDSKNKMIKFLENAKEFEDNDHHTMNSVEREKERLWYEDDAVPEYQRSTSEDSYHSAVSHHSFEADDPTKNYKDQCHSNVSISNESEICSLLQVDPSFMFSSANRPVEWDAAELNSDIAESEILSDFVSDVEGSRSGSCVSDYPDVIDAITAHLKKTNSMSRESSKISNTKKSSDNSLQHHSSLGNSEVSRNKQIDIELIDSSQSTLENKSNDAFAKNTNTVSVNRNMSRESLQDSCTDAISKDNMGQTHTVYDHFNPAYAPSQLSSVSQVTDESTFAPPSHVSSVSITSDRSASSLPPDYVTLKDISECDGGISDLSNIPRINVSSPSFTEKEEVFRDVQYMHDDSKSKQDIPRRDRSSLNSGLDKTTYDTNMNGPHNVSIPYSNHSPTTSFSHQSPQIDTTPQTTTLTESVIPPWQQNTPTDLLHIPGQIPSQATPQKQHLWQKVPVKSSGTFSESIENESDYTQQIQETTPIVSHNANNTSPPGHFGSPGTPLEASTPKGIPSAFTFTMNQKGTEVLKVKRGSEFVPKLSTPHMSAPNRNHIDSPNSMPPTVTGLNQTGEVHTYDKNEVDNCAVNSEKMYDMVIQNSQNQANMNDNEISFPSYPHPEIEIKKSDQTIDSSVETMTDDSCQNKDFKSGMSYSNDKPIGFRNVQLIKHGTTNNKNTVVDKNRNTSDVVNPGYDSIDNSYTSDTHNFSKVQSNNFQQFVNDPLSSSSQVSSSYQTSNLDNHESQQITDTGQQTITAEHNGYSIRDPKNNFVPHVINPAPVKPDVTSNIIEHGKLEDGKAYSTNNSHNYENVYSENYFNAKTCTAVATSTALARKDFKVTHNHPTMGDSVVSAVASAEATGESPFVAVARATARAATIATASAAKGVSQHEGEDHRDVTVMISTSCTLKDDSESDIKNTADNVIKAMKGDTNVAVYTRVVPNPNTILNDQGKNNKTILNDKTKSVSMHNNNNEIIYNNKSNITAQTTNTALTTTNAAALSNQYTDYDSSYRHIEGRKIKVSIEGSGKSESIEISLPSNISNSRVTKLISDSINKVLPVPPNDNSKSNSDALKGNYLRNNNNSEKQPLFKQAERQTVSKNVCREGQSQQHNESVRDVCNVSEQEQLNAQSGKDYSSTVVKCEQNVNGEIGTVQYISNGSGDVQNKSDSLSNYPTVNRNTDTVCNYTGVNNIKNGNISIKTDVIQSNNTRVVVSNGNYITENHKQGEKGRNKAFKHDYSLRNESSVDTLNDEISSETSTSTTGDIINHKKINNKPNIKPMASYQQNDTLNSSALLYDNGNQPIDLIKTYINNNKQKECKLGLQDPLIDGISIGGVGVNENQSSYTIKNLQNKRQTPEEQRFMSLNDGIMEVNRDIVFVDKHNTVRHGEKTIGKKKKKKKHKHEKNDKGNLSVSKTKDSERYYLENGQVINSQPHVKQIYNDQCNNINGYAEVRYDKREDNTESYHNTYRNEKLGRINHSNTLDNSIFYQPDASQNKKHRSDTSSRPKSWFGTESDSSNLHDTPFGRTSPYGSMNAGNSRPYGTLPKEFFSQGGSRTSVIETDLDTGLVTETPLVYETDLDNLTTPNRASSLGEIHIRRAEEQNEPPNTFERTQSLIYLNKSNGNKPSRLPKDKTDDETCTSENSQRVKKSLSKLNIPTWFKTDSSTGPVQLENTHRNVTSNTVFKVKSQIPSEGVPAMIVTTKPVVINRVITSNIANSRHVTPTHQPVASQMAEEFQLPSAKWKRESHSFRPIPIKALHNVGQSGQPHYQSNRPAKEAYLKLKAQQSENVHQNDHHTNTASNAQPDIDVIPSGEVHSLTDYFERRSQNTRRGNKSGSQQDGSKSPVETERKQYSHPPQQSPQGLSTRKGDNNHVQYQVLHAKDDYMGERNLPKQHNQQQLQHQQHGMSDPKSRHNQTSSDNVMNYHQTVEIKRSGGSDFSHISNDPNMATTHIYINVNVEEEVVEGPPPLPPPRQGAPPPLPPRRQNSPGSSTKLSPLTNIRKKDSRSEASSSPDVLFDSAYDSKGQTDESYTSITSNPLSNSGGGGTLNNMANTNMNASQHHSNGRNIGGGNHYVSSTVVNNNVETISGVQTSEQGRDIRKMNDMHNASYDRDKTHVVENKTNTSFQSSGDKNHARFGGVVDNSNETGSDQTGYNNNTNTNRVTITTKVNTNTMENRNYDDNRYRPQNLDIAEPLIEKAKASPNWRVSNFANDFESDLDLFQYPNSPGSRKGMNVSETLDSPNNITVDSSVDISRGNTTFEDMLDGLLGIPSLNSSMLDSSKVLKHNSLDTSVNQEHPLDKVYRILKKTQPQSPLSPNFADKSQNSTMSFQSTGTGGLLSPKTPLTFDSSVDTLESSATAINVDKNNSFVVRCRNPKCKKEVSLDEAKKTYKTCHNCFTYYCGRECRKEHWERHKTKCVLSRISSHCKHVIKKVHNEADVNEEMSRAARTGYIQKGRGSVVILFSCLEKADQFLKEGLGCLENPLAYISFSEIEESRLLGEQAFELLDLCRNYNPEIKYILEVIVVGSDQGAQTKGEEFTAVKKCGKLRLAAGHATIKSKKSKQKKQDHSENNSGFTNSVTEKLAEKDEYDINSNKENTDNTLILTPVPGADFTENMNERKSREIWFTNIQSKLRDRGISLRHEYSNVYKTLCTYVSDQTEFAPITLFPVDKKTGKSFMCLIMPNSEPDIEWQKSPGLMQELGLHTEV